jgi:anti-sigma factor RsiW
MNHQIYQDWLFALEDEALDEQQTSTLQAHLQECIECRRLAQAWQNVEGLLRKSPLVGPQAGFAGRVQARVQADRQRAYRRQTILTLGFYGVGAVLLSALIIYLAWPWLRSPAMLGWAWLYRAFVAYSFFGAVGDFLSTMLRAAARVVPLAGWVLLVGLVSELGVLWVVSLRLLTNPRRVSK